MKSPGGNNIDLQYGSPSPFHPVLLQIVKRGVGKSPKTISTNTMFLTHNFIRNLCNYGVGWRGFFLKCWFLELEYSMKALFSSLSFP